MKSLSTFDIFFFLIIALLVVSVFFINESQKLFRKNNLFKKSDFTEDDALELQGEISGIRITLLIVIALSLLIYFGFPALQEAGLEGHVMEWLNLVVRWAHVVLGIAWIGASFYFIFLAIPLQQILFQ